jgi:hypothetical protein
MDVFDRTVIFRLEKGFCFEFERERGNFAF